MYNLIIFLILSNVIITIHYPTMNNHSIYQYLDLIEKHLGEDFNLAISAILIDYNLGSRESSIAYNKAKLRFLSLIIITAIKAKREEVKNYYLNLVLKQRFSFCVCLALNMAYKKFLYKEVYKPMMEANKCTLFQLKDLVHDELLKV